MGIWTNFWIFLGVFLGILFVSIVSSVEVLPEWTHDVKLGGGVRVRWNSEDPSHLTMEMSAPSTGWVGVGFSPNGGMADIVMGWVDQRGRPHLKDLHGIGLEKLLLDPQQDYELLAGSEGSGRTVLVWRRRWSTCDGGNDASIGNDTVRLIWAYSSDDPEETSSDLTWSWHGATNRGVKSIYMRSPPRPFPFPDDSAIKGVLHMDFRVDNVKVDGLSTMYWCQIFKIPSLRRKHHMIGFRPIISPDNKPNIHHMVVYKCSGSVPLQSGHCYSEGKSPEWESCFTIMFTWAIGAEGEMLPDHMGVPLGGDRDSDDHYFKLEIHYDNPEKKNFVDTSGLRIFYTPTLRQFEAGILITGSKISPFHLIPPEQESFTTYSFCSAQCTSNGLPPEGIKLTSVMLHAHLNARRIKVRHIRNGKELTPIAEDKMYDFNYQQFRLFRNEIQILPGDELLIECEYSTIDKEGITLGGVATTHEMCQAYFLFYPKSQDFIDCRSQPEFYSFFNGIGIQNVSGDVLEVMGLPLDTQKLIDDESEQIPLDDSFALEKVLPPEDFGNPFGVLQISGPDHISGLTVGEYLDRMNWMDNGVIVQRHWREGGYYTFCAGDGLKKVPISQYISPYPSFEEWVPPGGPQIDCRNESRPTRNKKGDPQERMKTQIPHRHPPSTLTDPPPEESPVQGDSVSSILIKVNSLHLILINLGIFRIFNRLI